MSTFEGAPKSVEVLADDTEKGANSRENLPKRLNRYATAKTKALAISDYIRQNHPEHLKLCNTIDSCGCFLLFRDYYTIGDVRLVSSSLCRKHLLCPLCAIRRGSKMLARYYDRFDEVKTANGRLRAYMVTLTVKDGDNLSDRMKHLKKSLRYLHKKRHLKNRKSEAKKAEGAVWSYEVKRGKNSGLWHPHAHSIWLCEEEPNQEELSKEWKRITGDSFIVDVREISKKDPFTGFLEVFKYAVKFSDQSLSDTVHCFFTLKGQRLIGSFGLFYGIPDPDNLDDECLDDLPYVELFFNYLNGSYLLKNK